MKKVILFAITAVLASAILITAGVGAAADYQQQSAKSEIASEKVYFIFYNESFQVGAAAFCLDNRFTAFSDCEESMSFCSVDEAGNRTVLYRIPKENVKVRFSGETKHKIQLDPRISSLSGGLSCVGIVVDSEKTNIMITLKSQPIKRNTKYCIYIPENYFIDGNGNTNAGGYIDIEPSEVKAVSGCIIDDIMSLFTVRSEQKETSEPSCRTFF